MGIGLALFGVVINYTLQSEDFIGTLPIIMILAGAGIAVRAFFK